MKDTDLIPFGKHKGKMIGSLPAQYLLWLYDELKVKCSPFAEPILEYLEDNLQALKMELK
jgi:uncharacterized protein (DUF3820 family)